jgi:hypothetical protein
VFVDLDVRRKIEDGDERVGVEHISRWSPRDTMDAKLSYRHLDPLGAARPERS